MKCDDCDNPATFRCYAAYPLMLDNDPHPRVAHYPAAMIRACDEHFVEAMRKDAEAHLSTKGYFVELP